MVFDIETDGFDATKIHVLSYKDNEGNLHSTNDYDKMREFILNADTLVGHNIVGFDIPVLERLLGVKVPSTTMIVDTLAVSWYLNHKRLKHGLADYGKEYGVPKPKVDDWEGLTYEEYKHRCEEDVKINSKLWEDLQRKLNRLYRDDGYDKVLKYLTFKMQCAQDQAEVGWRLDVARAQKLFDHLTKEKGEKEKALAEAMPPRIITTKRSPPKVMYKKDGTLSAHGESWKQLLSDTFMPPSTMTEVTVKVGEEQGNPSSHQQVKDWLWALGWKPKTFKFVQGEKYGEERKIPQVRDGENLCSSVTDLIAVEPAIGLLEGLTVINHRLGIVKSFLECEEDGYLKAEIAGLTNTFRFKHRKPLVNLPGVDKPYGEDIRGCLLASEGNKLIGCDMVSLEDTTKRHYMQPLDPEYVEEMSKDGFDPHLDLAKHAGEVTQEMIDKHNKGVVDLKALRKNYKAANYACVYGVKETTLSRQTGMAKGAAKKLIAAYWQRNWAVEKVAKSRKVRELEGKKWIYNDVSGFWHSLRAEKDRWSTTNQSTGVYCFDTFVWFVKEQGVKIVGQFHDEIIVDSDDHERDTKILVAAYEELNKKVNLNVELKIDYQLGNNYSEIH